MGMHDAIFRRSAGAEPSDAYKPEQALSFEQALDICECSHGLSHAVVLTQRPLLSTDTIGAAYAAGEETRLGKIEPGYACDLTILNVDVSADPALLAEARAPSPPRHQ